MSTSTTPASTAPVANPSSHLHDNPSSSSHSTPASYTNPTHGTSTPTSTTSLDLTNLSSHPTFAAMFPDPDLPIANISRIMKRSLPDNAKIAKDAKECVQDCVSELISFITSEASDKCAAEKRKTINGDDILYAMRVLGFDNYEEVLRVYLSRYRMEQEREPKPRKRAERAPGKTGAPEEDDLDDPLDDDEADDAPNAQPTH